MKSFFEDLKFKSKPNERKFASSELIMAITEKLLCIMEKEEITKKELGERLGKSKTYVGQVLNGERNMTLSTLSDLCFELDIKPEIYLSNNKKKSTSKVSYKRTENISSVYSAIEKTDINNLQLRKTVPIHNSANDDHYGFAVAR